MLNAIVRERQKTLHSIFRAVEDYDHSGSLLFLFSFFFSWCLPVHSIFCAVEDFDHGGLLLFLFLFFVSPGFKHCILSLVLSKMFTMAVRCAIFVFCLFLFSTVLHTIFRITTKDRMEVGERNGASERADERVCESV